MPPDERLKVFEALKGICGRDLPKRGRLVDDRWEEVERAHDRQVGRHLVDGGVVGRIETDEQVGRRRLGTQPGQGFGEQVGPQLRGTAAAIGQVG